MPWQCKLTDVGHKREVGAIWRYKDEDSYIVTLPGVDTFFSLDSENGWTMTGELPNITITPSIRVHGGWHGYITGGIITDDLEGRKYP